MAHLLVADWYCQTCDRTFTDTFADDDYPADCPSCGCDCNRVSDIDTE